MAQADAPAAIRSTQRTGSWAGSMVIIVRSALFLAAAVIGPIVHAIMPEEVPPAHAHDEPPGSSGLAPPEGREESITMIPEEQDGHGHSDGGHGH